MPANWTLKPVLTIIAAGLVGLMAAFSRSGEKIDSLVALLKDLPEQEKVEILLEIAQESLSISPEKSGQALRKAMAISEKQNNKSAQAKALMIFGEYYGKMNKYKEALSNLEKAEQLYISLNDDLGLAYTYLKLGQFYSEKQSDHARAIDYYNRAKDKILPFDDKSFMMEWYNSYGVTFAMLGDYEKAMDYYQEARKLSNELKNIRFEARILMNLGNIYAFLNQNEKGLDFYKKSYKLILSSGDRSRLASVYNNLCIIYNRLKEFDSALYYSEKAYQIHVDFNNLKGQAKVLGNIATIYMELDSLELALTYRRKTLELSEIIGEKRGKSIALYNIGSTYLLMEEFDLAEKYILEALKIADSTNNKRLMHKIFTSLSVLYETKGDYIQALEYARLEKRINDTLFTEMINSKITDFEIKYETEKKEQEIKIKDLEISKNKGRIRLLAIVSLSVIIILIVGFIMMYMYYKNKSIRRQQKLQQDLNRYMFQALSQQMNPHFIFNTLNSLQYSIMEKDELRSSRFLALFSKLMRKTLTNAHHFQITVKEELEAIEMYLELESLRLKDKFSWKIKIEEGVDPYSIEIPNLLIQPYVENSIWHGIIPKKEKGNIRIFVCKHNLPGQEGIVCTIEDDGIGREKAMQIKAQKKVKHESLGTNITNKRIQVINSLYKKNIQIEYTDLKDNANAAIGTKVEIFIPL